VVIRYLLFVICVVALEKFEKAKFEELEVYRLSEKLADDIWSIVQGWEPFVKDTIGKQIVRSADSIGANIAEGTGRYNFRDNGRFVKIARGSLYETRHWLRRAYIRQLLTREQIENLKLSIDLLSPKLNAYLKYLETIARQRT
jgi:four helix bundle protein